MKRLLVAAFALFAATLASDHAHAGSVNGILQVYACDPTTNDGRNCLKPNSDGSINIAGSISAALAAYTPGQAYASLTATGSSARVALPAGLVVVAYNTGTTAVSCILGDGTVVATTHKDQIAPGGFFVYTVGANVDMACIDESGSASNLVALSGGTGLPAGSGGGGGSTSGAVTIADAADVTLGAKADAKSTATDTTAITVMQVLKEISAMVQAPPSQAVTNAGTFLVQNNAATPAGTNVIGHVIVDSAAGTAQGAAIAGQTLSPVAGQSLSATPTYTTAQTNIPTMDLGGAQVTRPYALPDVLVQGTTSAMTGTTSTSLIASPGGSLHNYITSLSCVNSHATVGTFVTVQDGSGGTALWTVAAAAVFGGTVVNFPAPLRQPTAATALYVADVTTGANVICSASGFKAP